VRSSNGPTVICNVATHKEDTRDGPPARLAEDDVCSSDATFCDLREPMGAGLLLGFGHLLEEGVWTSIIAIKATLIGRSRISPTVSGAPGVKSGRCQIVRLDDSNSCRATRAWRIPTLRRRRIGSCIDETVLQHRSTPLPRRMPERCYVDSNWSPAMPRLGGSLAAAATEAPDVDAVVLHTVHRIVSDEQASDVKIRRQRPIQRGPAPSLR
jgi:hypothetical protein